MVLNNLQQMAFDSFEMIGSENPLSIPVPLDEESNRILMVGTHKVHMPFSSSTPCLHLKNWFFFFYKNCFDSTFFHPIDFFRSQISFFNNFLKS